MMHLNDINYIEAAREAVARTVAKGGLRGSPAHYEGVARALAQLNAAADRSKGK